MLKDFGCWILTVSFSWISLWEPLVPYAYCLYIVSTLIFCSIVPKDEYERELINLANRTPFDDRGNDLIRLRDISTLKSATIIQYTIKGRFMSR